MKGADIMPRFFAIDTKNNNEMVLVGAIDKSTGEWTARDDEQLRRVRESAHERLTDKVNELLGRDPTLPFAYKGEAQVKTI